jgi:hypothetical protein
MPATWTRLTLRSYLLTYCTSCLVHLLSSANFQCCDAVIDGCRLPQMRQRRP